MGRIFTEHLQVTPPCFPSPQACLPISASCFWWLAACLAAVLCTAQGRVFTCRLCGNHLASNLELISKASRAPFPLLQSYTCLHWGMAAVWHRPPWTASYRTQICAAARHAAWCSSLLSHSLVRAAPDL